MSGASSWIMVISDEILEAAQVSEAEIRAEIALALFAQERLTLGQAAWLTVDRRFGYCATGGSAIPPGWHSPFGHPAPGAPHY